MKWPKFGRKKAPTEIAGNATAERRSPAQNAPRKTARKAASLARELKPEGANPYETHSWELDREKILRRVEPGRTGKKTVKGEPGDPYNTGSFNKVW